MENKEKMFNELTHISDSFDGEYISFDVDVLKAWLLDLGKESDKNYIIIGDYLKTIQDNNKKFSELYGVIHDLHFPKGIK
jgi:hypothetical protein